MQLTTEGVLQMPIDTLTTGIRADIERHAAIGGGISRANAQLLLAHIDRLRDLLNEVMEGGQDWTDAEWATFIDAALPLVDGWTVKVPRLPPHVAPCRGPSYRDDWCSTHVAKWSPQEATCTGAQM